MTTAIPSSRRRRPFEFTSREPLGEAAYGSNVSRRINVGPRKTLPLRLEADVADKMDEAWRAKGIKNRMEFFRGAIGHYLAHLGARDAAALFTNAGTTGA